MNKYYTDFDISAFEMINLMYNNRATVLTGERGAELLYSNNVLPMKNLVVIPTLDDRTINREPRFSGGIAMSYAFIFVVAQEIVERYAPVELKNKTQLTELEKEYINKYYG